MSSMIRISCGLSRYHKNPRRWSLTAKKRADEGLVLPAGASIGEFQKDFDVQYEALLGASVTATTAPELAMLFLRKSDPHRYATMLA